MSTPGEYYRSLPPVSKTYGVLCLLTTSAYYLQLFDHQYIYLSYTDVIKKLQILPMCNLLLCMLETACLLQIWRLVTNFFFLAPFSVRFGVRLLMIARYWVLLEKGAFDKRTADFLWMTIFGALSLLVIAAIPPLWSPFLGVSLVFMHVYVWSRENPNARISIYGVVTIKGFYLPWAFLALDLIFGVPLKPDIIGIVAGHLFYFLSVLYPLSGGRNILKTPLWVHKVVMFWGEGVQVNSPVQSNPSAGVAFRGRSYRLNQ